MLMSAYEKVTDLAYGENPHQRAAYYAQVGARMHVLSMVKQVAGKDLSFNNVLDLNSGRLLVEEFNVPACAIIKHNNPCGVGDRQLRPRGLRARVRVRPAVGVRRRRLPQPPGRPRAGRAARWSSSARCCSRPHYTEDALELLESQAEHAHPRGQRAAPVRHRRARPQARDGRAARAGPRHRPRGPLARWRS